MQIDTEWFKAQRNSCKVTMTLETDIERALTDEQLLSVASHQHLMRWMDGHAYLTSRAIRGRVPCGWSITRSGSVVTALLDSFAPLVSAD